MSKMLSNKPYLLRAFYQWIVDSSCTPIMVVDAKHPRCKIPQDFITGTEIVFNISPAAIRDFKATNELVEFRASFSGIVYLISVPVGAVLAIYAEENNEGLFFDAEEEETGTQAVSLVAVEGMNKPVSVEMEQESIPVAKGKPFLRLIDNTE